VSWIDYQKAFDRVPHSWIIESLEINGTNNKTIIHKENRVFFCRINMCLHTENKLIETEDIEIQCGIF
jgi:hypothetical protein